MVNYRPQKAAAAEKNAPAPPGAACTRHSGAPTEKNDGGAAESSTSCRRSYYDNVRYTRMTQLSSSSLYIPRQSVADDSAGVIGATNTFRHQRTPGVFCPARYNQTNTLRVTKVVRVAHAL